MRLGLFRCAADLVAQKIWLRGGFRRLADSVAQRIRLRNGFGRTTDSVAQRIQLRDRIHLATESVGSNKNPLRQKDEVVRACMRVCVGGADTA